MANLTFTVDSDRRARRFLERAREAIKDFKPALKEASEYQLAEIQKQFSSEGSKFGNKWARRKDKLPHPILNKTGKLKKSFKQTKLTKDELNITSPVEYFKFHQLGTRKMPQRKILEWARYMQKGTVDILINYIKRKLNG